ncbi:MAG: hypothetical protein KAS72_13470 [Phycisphaerales bacterium]|nr:hypothetical protein [Phycisphaerales bacterium]
MTPSVEDQAKAAESYARTLFHHMLLGWVQDVALLRYARLDRPCQRGTTPALELRRAA